MERFYRLRDFIAWNEKQECSADGCHKRRFRKSKYCNNHYTRMAYMGALEGKIVIEKPDFMPWATLCRKVLEKNIADHGGIRMVIRYINSRMEAATRGETIKSAKFWKGLALYEASPIDIIARAGSVYVLWLNKSPILKSEVHLQYNVAHAVSSLLSKTKCKLNSQHYVFKSVGQDLDGKFRLFFLSLAKAVLEMIDRKQERERILSQGFK